MGGFRCQTGPAESRPLRLLEKRLAQTKRIGPGQLWFLFARWFPGFLGAMVDIGLGPTCELSDFVLCSYEPITSSCPD